MKGTAQVAGKLESSKWRKTKSFTLSKPYQQGSYDHEILTNDLDLNLIQSVKVKGLGLGCSHKGNAKRFADKITAHHSLKYCTLPY